MEVRLRYYSVDGERAQRGNGRAVGIAESCQRDDRKMAAGCIHGSYTQGRECRNNAVVITVIVSWSRAAV